jgi:hypothetical protein
MNPELQQGSTDPIHEKPLAQKLDEASERIDADPVLSKDSLTRDMEAAMFQHNDEQLEPAAWLDARKVEIESGAAAQAAAANVETAEGVAQQNEIQARENFGQ